MKSRMPEIVEPKQLIQSRVLVKRARLLEAASANRGGGNSEASANQISLRKPLQGETFTIYSAGRSQASNKDFQSPN